MQLYMKQLISMFQWIFIIKLLSNPGKNYPLFKVTICVGFGNGNQAYNKSLHNQWWQNGIDIFVLEGMCWWYNFAVFQVRKSVDAKVITCEYCIRPCYGSNLLW